MKSSPPQQDAVVKAWTADILVLVQALYHWAILPFFAINFKVILWSNWANQLFLCDWYFVVVRSSIFLTRRFQYSICFLYNAIKTRLFYKKIGFIISCSAIWVIIWYLAELLTHECQHEYKILHWWTEHVIWLEGVIGSNIRDVS